MDMRRRAAGIFLRRGSYYVYPFHRTTAGVLLGVDPVVVLPETATDFELGVTVHSALEGYREGVRHPSVDEFEAMPDPLLAAAGVRDLSTFARGARCCDVFVENGEISIVPSEDGERRGERKGTYFPLPERQVTVPGKASNEEIGAAVKEAIRRGSSS